MPDGSTGAPPFTLSAGTILHIFGAAAGALWSLAAIEAYTFGVEPPSADPLGVVRAVVYLPLIGAAYLGHLGVPVAFVTLTIGLGILAGLVLSVLARRRLDA